MLSHLLKNNLEECGKGYKKLKKLLNIGTIGYWNYLNYCILKQLLNIGVDLNPATQLEKTFFFFLLGAAVAYY